MLVSPPSFVEKSGVQAVKIVTVVNNVNRYDLSEQYTGVQRDLYSAFLIGHIEKGRYQQKQLEQDFPAFYEQMKNFLQQAPKTERLAWYLN